MRPANHYAALKAEHQTAPEQPETAEVVEPAREAPASAPAPYEPSWQDQIEARVAEYEFTMQRKVDAGLISRADYFHGLRQLDSDLAREIRGQQVPLGYEPAIDAPAQSAEQQREARINPEPAPAAKLADEKAEKLTQGREVSEAAQARIERLTAEPTDELELRQDQEMGRSPSRGRGL